MAVKLPAPYGDFDRVRKILESWNKQLAPIARQLTAAANPPALQQMARYLNFVTGQWNEVLSKVDWDKVAALWKQGLPPNWADVEPPLRVADVLDVMREERWCLVWAPRGEIVRRLVDARAEQRTPLFVASSAEIVDDCRSVLDTIEHPELQQVRLAATEVADALDAGVAMAAQALAASCLGEIVHSRFEMTFGAAKERFAVDDLMRVPTVRFRPISVLFVLTEALERFRPERGDPMPVRFARHACAHSVSADQYTHENALAGLLLVTALAMEAELMAQQQSDDDVA